MARAVEQRRREGPGGGSYNERERERQKAKEREREKERERRNRQNGGGAGGSSRPGGSSSKRNIDWFEFFLAASVDVDDCTRYAAAFERDKIDEAILPELDPPTLRTLGLREGDIIRVRKFIDRKYKPQAASRSSTSDPAAQLKADEEMARKLQEQESSARRGNSTSPAPGLFSGPDGSLKNNTRRGRPAPSSRASTGVDAASLAAASESLARTATPPTRTSTTSPEIQRGSSAQAVKSPSTTIASGFDDDAWTPRPSSAKPSTPAVVAPTPPAPAPVAPNPPPAAPVVVAPVTPAEPPKPPADPNSALFDKLAAMRPPSGGVSPRPGASPVNGSMLNNGYNPNAPRGPLAPVPGNQGLLQPLLSTQGTGQFIPTRQQPMQTGMQPQQTGWGGMQGMQPQQTGWGGMQQQQPQQTGFGGMGMGMSSPQSPYGNGGAMVNQQTGFPGMNGGMQPQQTGWGGMGQQQQPQMTSNVSGFGLPQQNQQQQQQPQQPEGNKFAASNIFAQMKTGQFGKDPNSSAQDSSEFFKSRAAPLYSITTLLVRNSDFSSFAFSLVLQTNTMLFDPSQPVSLQVEYNLLKE